MSQGRIHFPKRRGEAEEWTWKAGRSTVAIRDPKRRKFAIPLPEITGCNWTQIERARWKQSPSICIVTPAKVKKYIERKLRKK